MALKISAHVHISVWNMCGGNDLSLQLIRLKQQIFCLVHCLPLAPFAPSIVGSEPKLVTRLESLPGGDAAWVGKDTRLAQI